MLASYLTSRHELQRAQRRLQVLGVVLEVVQSIGERGLQLGGALSRRGVGGDLVEGSHDCAVQTGVVLILRAAAALPCRLS